MSHQTKIWLYLLLKSSRVYVVSVLNTFVHILLRAITDIRPPRFDISSEKEKACGSAGEKNLVWMKCESEVFEKILNSWNEWSKYISVFMQENHIIHISAIVPDFECMFYEMIKFVKVEISENLAHEVSEWKSTILWSREKTFMFWKVWIDCSWEMLSRVVEEDDFEEVHKYSLSLSSQLCENIPSYPRRRVSSPVSLILILFLTVMLFVYANTDPAWIPAFAGMTDCIFSHKVSFGILLK